MCFCMCLIPKINRNNVFVNTNKVKLRTSDPSKFCLDGFHLITLGYEMLFHKSIRLRKIRNSTLSLKLFSFSTRPSLVILA